MNQNQNKVVTPKIVLLNNENINQIHNFSLSILEHTGIRVESLDALNTFKKSGGVTIKDDIVFIGRELIEYSITTAPSKLELFYKDGTKAFQLGPGQKDTYFGIGVTNPWFQQIENNNVIPFTRKHTRITAALSGLLANFDMLSTPGVPADVDPRLADIYNSLDMVVNSDKPVIQLISQSGILQKVFDLLDHMGINSVEKPFGMLYLNPVSPLVMNADTSEKMKHAIKEGMPVMYSNYSMYGATTPVSEAGTLALMNAELLAGLVYSQLVKEGSKIVLGSLPAAFNMNTMGSFYTSSSYLLNLACAEMMDHYSIPHCGTSGSSNGWGPDLLASSDLWLNHLTSCIGKVGCAPFVGGNFDSLAFSPSNVVLADQIIGKARKFARGFSLDSENINIEEIASAGPGGNYFTANQTLTNLHDLAPDETIWPSLSLEKWRETGKKKAEEYLTDRTFELWEKARKKAKKKKELIREGERYITENLMKHYDN